MEHSDSTNTQSVWSDKPGWCQPWTILLTGSSIITASWLIFGRLWLSFLVVLPIAVWWYYFLVVYPKIYQSIRASDYSDSQNVSKVL